MVLIITALIVELATQALIAVLIYASYYFLVFGYGIVFKVNGGTLH